MMRTLKSGLTIGMLVAAMALTSGCGDNDNSDNGNDNGNPNPQRTATPAPQRTATPANPDPTPTATGGSPVTQTVDFDFTAANGIQAFQIRVAYQTADGSFTGSAENVACTITGGGGIFTKNDNESGALFVSLANASNLTFPVTVRCGFDATGTVAASDFAVQVQEVTQNNAPGDASVLSVAVTVP